MKNGIVGRRIGPETGAVLDIFWTSALREEASAGYVQDFGTNLYACFKYIYICIYIYSF